MSVLDRFSWGWGLDREPSTVSTCGEYYVLAAYLDAATVVYGPYSTQDEAEEVADGIERSHPSALVDVDDRTPNLGGV